MSLAETTQVFKAKQRKASMRHACTMLKTVQFDFVTNISKANG